MSGAARRRTPDAVDAGLGVNTRYRDLTGAQRGMLQEILEHCRRRRRIGHRGSRLRAMNAAHYLRVKRLLGRVDAA